MEVSFECWSFVLLSYGAVVLGGARWLLLVLCLVLLFLLLLLAAGCVGWWLPDHKWLELGVAA